MCLHDASAHIYHRNDRRAILAPRDRTRIAFAPLIQSAIPERERAHTVYRH